MCNSRNCDDSPATCAEVQNSANLWHTNAKPTPATDSCIKYKINPSKQLFQFQLSNTRFFAVSYHGKSQQFLEWRLFKHLQTFFAPTLCLLFQLVFEILKFLLALLAGNKNIVKVPNICNDGTLIIGFHMFSNVEVARTLWPTPNHCKLEMKTSCEIVCNEMKTACLCIPRPHAAWAPVTSPHKSHQIRILKISDASQVSQHGSVWGFRKWT